MRNKLILVVSVLIILNTSLYSQQGFLKIFDSSQQEAAVFLDIVNDNDTLVFYGLSDNVSGVQGIGFYQIDTFGNVLNKNVITDPEKTLTTSYDSNKKIIRTSAGNYAMIGTTDGGNFFLKVNKKLELLSYVFYPSSSYIGNETLVEDGSGFLLVFAKEQPNNALASDVLLIKTDVNGLELWRQVHGTYEFDESPSEIIRINNNQYVICGAYNRYPAQFEDHLLWSSSYFLSIDSSGNELWNWHSDTTEINGFSNKVFQLSDLGWLTSGVTWEWNDGEYIMRPILTRMDENFKVIWEKVFGYLGQFQGWQDLNRTPDGNFIVSGFADLVTTPAYPKAVHYKFTPEGDSIWLRQDSMYAWDHMRVSGTAVLSSGSIISVGYNRDGPYGETGFIMKLTQDGCLDTLNCFPLAGGDPVNIVESLYVYPNPASNTIHIRMLDKGLRKKKVRIMNLQGQVFMERKSQNDKLELDISFLAPGFYLIEVISQNKRYLDKFVKMKEL